ncbi:MAG TPA: aspartate--tRNA(Asn) ligase [Candidatus Saccharimonadia bacterium]
MSKSKIIAIADVANHVDENVTVRGWVQTIRDQSKIKFMIIRDVSGTVQSVLLTSAKQPFELSADITTESVIALTGKAVAAKQAPGGVEIVAEHIEALSLADPQLPIQVIDKNEEEADLNTRLDWRWIDLRKPEKQLLFKTWTVMDQAFHNHLVDNGYIQIYSPKLINTASESGAEVFEVAYFDRKAYLAQSPQFYKQMAMASGLEKVFEAGPVFRAEPSFTTRHSTEFTGYDLELAYVDSHQDVMEVQEELLVAMMQAAKKAYGPAISEHYGERVVVPSRPFPQVTLQEAKEMLQAAGVKSEKADDLNPEEERELSKLIQARDGHEFVFVTDYPVTARPFYHMRYEDKPGLTKSYDLLFRGIEITTGAQREHRHEVLIAQAQEKHMDLDSLSFYFNFFKYGCPPHGGLGMGPNRLLMRLFNVPSLREAMYVYRGPHRLVP